MSENGSFTPEEKALALPLRAVKLNEPGGFEFGWCAVDAEDRVIGYCMTETQAKQLVAPFLSSERTPHTEPGDQQPQPDGPTQGRVFSPDKSHQSYEGLDLIKELVRLAGQFENDQKPGAYPTYGRLLREAARRLSTPSATLTIPDELAKAVRIYCSRIDLGSPVEKDQWTRELGEFIALNVRHFIPRYVGEKK